MSHASLGSGRTHSRSEARHRRRNKRNSGAYHYRPLLEPLEQRRLLTSVTGQDPSPNTHDSPVTTDVSAVFDTDINSATVSAQTFAVHGMQTGQVLDSFSVSGDSITLSPDAPFHPGELVQATLTTAIENLGGEPLAEPSVWQFRTAASGGTGLFGDSGQSLGNSRSYSVALGDVDGDGDLDVFMANRGSNDRANKVWLNDGSGSFSDSGQSLGDSRSAAVALGDVDGDGDLDAFVGNGPGADKVWLNDGNGNFSDSGQSLGDSWSPAVALGDLDGDGDLDAFVGNGGGNKVWLNDGSGNFTDSDQSLGDSSSGPVALGDLDGDGDLDAFVGNGGGNKVWLNDGSGNFTDSGQSLGDSSSGAVALGDLDGDGDLDAFVGNFRSSRVWLNDGSGNFSDSGQSLGNSITRAAALGDVDGDGDLDAFVGNFRGHANRVWLNDGSGNFADSGQDLGESYSDAVALGDVDGDSDLDAVVGNSEFALNKVWLNADIPADLSIAMSNGQFFATPEQSVTYTITVTNHGPEGVTGAIVTDIFPVEITEVTWTCTASAGASCTASGTRNINDTITLPAGGTATYSATGQLSPTASSTITNVATVVAPMGWDDIGLSNNTARDTDVVLALDLTPQPGSHTAPADTDVSVKYDEDVDPASVSSQTFAVHGMQTGQILESYSVSGDTVTLSPDAPFHPGELVQATLTTGIENLGGEPLADPFVWQFRTAVTGGTGLFGDSGQSLGESFNGAAVALGDVDGDGDLDVLVRENVWLNDGNSNFSNTGQALGYGGILALGDVDGDGDLDAFIGARHFGSPSLVWMNDGSGIFTDSGQRLDNEYSQAIALGDLDGDGDLDAFVGNSNDNKVWLNDGSGNFNDSGQTLGRSAAVALGDVDGDGDLDAFVKNVLNKVWLNDGTGNFTDTGQSLGNPASEGVGAVALGDVDGDGDLDAFVGNGGYFSEPNKVWLNDGSGTFTDSVQRLGDSRSLAVALGDVDGDGDLDAFVGNRSPEGNKVWLNDGSGNFSDSGQILGNSSSQAVALGDLNGDGDLDALVGNDGANKVWLNAGFPTDLSVAMTDGQFLATPGEFITYTITVTNLGPEGVTDAIVTDIFPVEISDVSWTCTASASASCTGSGTGNINDTISLPASGTATYTATGQLSLTATGSITNVVTVAAPMGLDDIGRVNNTASDTVVVPTLDVTPQLGTHTAPVDTDVSAMYGEDINPATVSAQNFAVHAMQTGQILESLTVTGDTITLSPNAPFHPGELVQATATSGIENLGGEPLADPFVWQFRTKVGLGTGLFGDAGQSLENSNSRAVALGDVDGDGDLDAFIGDSGPNQVWLNDGDSNFTDSGQSLGNSRTNAVALGDMDGDGDLDAVVGNQFDQPNKVWMNDGSGNFSDSGQSLGNSGSGAVALVDVDGDGDLDAFVDSKVWLNDGSGNFIDSGQSLGSSGSVAFGDLDGDGDLDAFVGNRSYSSGQHNKVWLNDGSGNFSDSGQILGNSSSQAVALGDVDGDGDLDAFVGNTGSYGAPNTVWLNEGSGNFTDSGQSLGNSASLAVTLGDVDGDGDLDAFVANRSIIFGGMFFIPGPDKVWLNDGSGTITDSGQTLGLSDTRSVALGDVDGDGDLDAFVGNGDEPNKVWLNQDPIPGDVDNDQDVDGNDFLIWQAGFGIQSGATRYDGDADFDGDVDGDDFQIWQDNFPTATAVGSASAAPAAKNSDSDRLDFSTSQSKAVDKTLSERGNARWTKRSLRDELVDQLSLFK